jgi:hypothetical protein
MSLATDSNAAASNAALVTEPGPAGGAAAGGPDEVERALAAAIADATRIGDLLDSLREARLWLPLTADRALAGDDGAVTLPTVTYLGCEFIPAYSSQALLIELAGRCVPGLATAGPAGEVPHAVVGAADLARLLPPDVGIALNVGASQSVPVYPQGVAFLAADEQADERRVSVGPLPVRPDALLAAVRLELARVPQVREASAGWLSVQFAGEGLLFSVTLDDPADATARDDVVGALERAAAAARPQASYPIDVTFPGEGAPDHIDRWIATAARPFYVRDPA